ncbi:MAG: LysM peptidoglycan-binding domain-containing protein [Rhizobiaceae bacterium]|nr:LysM peptidoglycan-binding domain-containing protein [Rhizobiaceae bacterium]
MKRKATGVIVFCLLLLGAIVAGYWDMLNAEKLRVVRDRTSDAVGEIAAIVRPDRSGRPSDGAADPASPAAPDVSTPSPAALPPAGGEQPEAGELEPPTFDILRVEPDGSALVAGRAPAGATITLYDGEKPVAKESASGDGEFVIVLDPPLPVGDHALRIGVELPDGRLMTSAETAIVSIPEAGREKELLAIVEAPDRGSRLISVPSTRTAAPDGAVPNDTEEATDGDLLLPSPAPGENPSDKGLGGTPGAGSLLAPLVNPVDKGVAAVSSQAAPVEPPASAPPSSTAAAPATDRPANFAVEAVEIEDDRIFVAGRAPEDASVRVYVDDDFLGEGKSVRGDRFLVTARRSLAPGGHSVRADALGRTGEVFARVEVPFAKPEGRSMSAIAAPPVDMAPPAGNPNSQTQGSSGPLRSGVPMDPGSGERVGDNVEAAAAPAANTATTPPEEPPLPGLVDTAAVSGRPPTNGQDASPPDGPAEGPARSADPDAPAESMTAAVGQTTDRPTEQSVEPETRTASAADPALVPESMQTTDEPVQTDPVFAPFKAAAPNVDAVPTTRQPPLEAAASRVIIRRGDTLWRISRETYGLGRRFTVIYLANGDQIRDPDRIYPGQVFRVPDDGDAEAKARGGVASGG